MRGITDHYPIAIHVVSLNGTNPKLSLLKILSNDLNGKFSQVSTSGNGGLSYNDIGFMFSPDGQQILFTNYDQGSIITVLDLETEKYVDNIGRNITPDSQIKRIGNIYWLP